LESASIYKNQKMKAKVPLSVVFAFVVLLVSCKKLEYLDENPNNDNIIPETISDLQAILDNTSYMNGDQMGVGVNPIIGEAAADNYYITPGGFAILNSVSPALQNIYTWNDNIYNQGMVHTDWSFPYRAVLYANSVMEALARIKDAGSNPTAFNNLQGSALFFRSEMFYQLAQIFAKHYNKDSAAMDGGILLKLSADINERVKRATIAETYERIVTDLKKAIPLLPITPLYKTRPSRPAAYALLARVYLTMQEYDSSIVYAGACLQLHDKLLDYKTLQNPASDRALPDFPANDEVIFHSNLVNTTIYTLFNTMVYRVDTSLYSLYEQQDLRRMVFFGNASPSGNYFKGSYSGNYRIMWGGIATDEVLLTRAECYARKGNVPDALNDLNKLLEKRWAAGTFVPYSTANADTLREKVLLERRKELIFRGLRWTDLRRLNGEGANIKLTRNAAGIVYALEPKSCRYTFLIPPDVISFSPNMPQNCR
jgi:starch-binding outer membrane protein, SusD/RagB family